MSTRAQTPKRGPVVLRDPKAIKALAHPARLAVLEESLRQRPTGSVAALDSPDPFWPPGRALPHRCVINVPLRVNEEVIFPVHLLAGPLLDIRQVDPVFLEDIQHLRQRARLMRGGKHDGGLVITRASCAFATYDEKTRLVVRIVLDVLEQNPQSVQLPGKLAADGRDAGLL